jgi:hypothetical protein
MQLTQAAPGERCALGKKYFKRNAIFFFTHVWFAQSNIKSLKT